MGQMTQPTVSALKENG